MPIEIKIDSGSLLRHEIDALYNYLIAVHDADEKYVNEIRANLRIIPENVVYNTVEEQEETKQSTDVEPSKPKKRGRPPKESSEPKYNTAEVPGGFTQTVIRIEESPKDLNLSEPIKPLNINKPLVTYDTLISFVLEATRTRQLTFEKTTELLNRFNVGCIADLENMPHLIPSVYEAFKELNNEG